MDFSISPLVLIRLENEFQSELQYSRISSCGHSPERARAHRCSDRLVIDVIEEIERFCSELQVHTFRKRSILHQRHIIAPQARTVHSSTMFNTVQCSTDCWVGESGGIEPLSEGV